MPIEVALSQNTTVNQTLYTVQHILNGTSFVDNDNYYVTVEAYNTAGSANQTANSTTVCFRGYPASQPTLILTRHKIQA